MRAVAITAFGAPDTLSVVDWPAPMPGVGEVSIDVDAAAVGFIDVLFRRGDFADTINLPFVPGIEVAGRVRALGEGVEHLHIGQPVVTLSRPGGGGYAEIALASATATIPVRLRDGRRMNAVTAVSTVPNVVAALGALQDAAHLRPAETALVHGATGGLASTFPGVARSLGAARITGTVSDPANIAAARRLGYDDVLLTGEFPAITERFDVIVDPVGGMLRGLSVEKLKPLGRLLVLGNASGGADHHVGANQFWIANASVVGVKVGGLLREQPERAAPLAQHALELMAEGEVTVPVQTLDLTNTASAHHRLEARSVTGKLVLTTSRGPGDGER